MWIRRSSYFPHNMTETTFDPIPDLHVNDSDIHLIGLRNSATFMAKVNDPWFSATFPKPGTDPIQYLASNVLSFVGCTIQYQFCTTSDCSPLTGFYGITDDSTLSPALSSTQQAIFSLLRKAMWATKLDYAIKILGKEMLLANDYIWDRGFQSSPLAETHWQSEMLNFHNLSLSLLQRRVVEFASPQDIQVQPGVSALAYIVRPSNPELLSLCNSIKIRTTSYLNFSVLGLALTLTTGSLIVIFDFFLLPIVGNLQNNSVTSLYRRREWTGTSTLQLFRIACEGHGIGGQKFSLLDLASKIPQDASGQEELGDQGLK